MTSLVVAAYAAQLAVYLMIGMLFKSDDELLALQLTLHSRLSASLLACCFAFTASPFIAAYAAT